MWIGKSQEQEWPIIAVDQVTMDTMIHLLQSEFYDRNIDGNGSHIFAFSYCLEMLCNYAKEGEQGRDINIQNYLWTS